MFGNTKIYIMYIIPKHAWIYDMSIDSMPFNKTKLHALKRFLHLN